MIAPTISVVTVVRDEALARLERLVAAIASSVNVDSVEVVIAAQATDLVALRSLAGPRASGPLARVLLVENPSGERSAGLNRALERSSGSIICRLDARSIPRPDYLHRCADRLLSDPDIAVVGGRQLAVAGGPDSGSRGIARALRNPWLLGGAAYRRADTFGPADTVYLGSFRRDDLVAIGGWDERLVANEDYELCQRFRSAGRIVWREASLDVDYEARTTLRALAGQYHAFGRAKVAYWKRARRRPAMRQVIAIAGAFLALTGVAASVRRPQRLVGLVTGFVLALFAVDHASEPAERSLQVRGRSVLASAVLVSGWLSGIVSALVRSADH